MTIKSSTFLAVTFAALLIAAGCIVTAVHAYPSQVISQATATATTTYAFILPGTATSTYQVDSPTFSTGKIANMSTVDAQSVYVIFDASTSASTLGIAPQYSNNGIDWYGYNQQTNATPASGGVVLLATTTAVYQWTPGNTVSSTTGMVFTLPAVPAYHERLVFTAVTGNGAVYAETDLKQNPSTP